MCAPIYKRLRQSANSISSLLNLLSNNKNETISQQFNCERLSNNRNDPCSSNYKTFNYSEYINDT